MRTAIGRVGVLVTLAGAGGVASAGGPAGTGPLLSSLESELELSCRMHGSVDGRSFSNDIGDDTRRDEIGAVESLEQAAHAIDRDLTLGGVEGLALCDFLLETSPGGIILRYEGVAEGKADLSDPEEFHHIEVEQNADQFVRFRLTRTARFDVSFVTSNEGDASFSVHLSGPSVSLEFEYGEPGAAEGFVMLLREGEYQIEVDSRVRAQAGPGQAGHAASRLDGSFELTSIALPGCNAADVAAPFGVHDFGDVAAFMAAFSEGSYVADVAAPFGVWDVTDVHVFLIEFGSDCP